MADIQKLTYPYFTDGSTQLNAQNLNPIISKINEMIEAINSGVTPTPTQTVATPTISISGTTVTIACSTSGASIRYTTDGSIPTSSSGTVYSAAFTPASGTTIIKAIAYKTGMTNSSVATQSYQGEEPETAQILARYTKSISSAQRSALNTFVASLKSSGVYSKVKYLMLPFLANNSTEAVQNAVDGEYGTPNNPTSVVLENNSIRPKIGEPIAIITGLSDIDTTNMHVSYYSVDVVADYSGKWDAACGIGAISCCGNNINVKGLGVNYTDSGDNNIRWTPDEFNNYDGSAKLHVIHIGGSDHVAMSVNGTYLTDTEHTPTTITSTKPLRLFLSLGSSSTTYLSTSDGTTLSTASQHKYGLFSVGETLTQTEAVAFNNAVNTLMNVIFS